MQADLAFSRERHLGLITLTRPEALNALSLPMIKAMQEQLKQWESDDDIQAVVIRAEGSRAFCAGGDVRWLYDAGLAKSSEQMQFFWHEYRLNYFINQYPKPYISLMDGITMGGGVGISLHGSHPVATERFVFAMPETGIGFFPDIGASYLLARCPANIGIYLALSGNHLTAVDACAAGLVKTMIASDQINKVLESLIDTDLSQHASERVGECLQAFALSVSEAPLERLKDSISRCFAHETVEKIMDALSAEGDEWALATLDILKQKAPLSLKVTLAQVQRAKHLSLAECLKMDYRLVSHFMRDRDFYEGIRALLIDKDKAPHWQPERLDLVEWDKVADYFNSDGMALNLNAI